MRLLAITLALPFAALAVPAAAKEPAGEPTEIDKQVEAEAPKKICRYVVEGTGSRRKTKLCLTKDQWVDFNRGN